MTRFLWSEIVKVCYLYGRKTTEKANMCKSQRSVQEWVKKFHRRVDIACCEQPASVTCGEAKKQIDWLDRDNRENIAVSIASENNSRYEQKRLSMASGRV